MSRSNNVRGPSSALTEFLRVEGITPTTIARRARTRIQAQSQPEAGTSGAVQDENAEERAGSEAGNEAETAYNSDNLDDDDAERPAAKKRKLAKAAEKAKGKEKEKGKETTKGKGKKKAKKGSDDDYEDSDEDAYTALSKMWKSDMPKPPAGDIVDCAKCKKQFTVTKYTLAANPPPGWLCHPCSKASGVDPFKKPAAPRKRKTPGEKRVVVNFEERRLPSLVSMCIQLISEHIDDVEALGDIGRINMDEIAKAISKNRSLTPQNAPLFYDVTNTDLTLYDVTNLTPPSLCALASLNPNLVNLRLDLCGRINDSVIDEWCTSLPNLKRIELLGPFLVKAPAWQAFFKAHRRLEGFLITQSPRFDVECMRALVENCPNLSELRLKEIGQFSDDFLPLLKPLAKCLASLELSYPGDREAPSEAALIELLRAVGAGLTHLDLSGNVNIGDGFLFRGIKPHTLKLSSLTLADTPALTDAGVAEFFDTWAAASGHAPNPPLVVINMSRNHLLKGDALITLLKHSGEALTLLNINGWREASEDALRAIAEYAPQIRKLDIGFCREVNDYTIKALLEGCVQLEEAKVWGCQRVTITCPRKRGVSIEGIEAQSLA